MQQVELISAGTVVQLATTYLAPAKSLFKAGQLVGSGSRKRRTNYQQATNSHSVAILTRSDLLQAVFPD